MIFRFLVSFHYHQKTDLQTIVDSYAGPYQAFADSGAFSAYSLGATISLKDYAAWLTEWDRLLTVKATLDVIGDPGATMRNTRKLEDMGHRVLPVFHVGTPWDRLEKLCAEYDYIALGGMVPFKGNGDGLMRWLVKCFRVAKATGTVFHGFGQTRIGTLKALPFYSVDSSAWVSGTRFGQLYMWDNNLGNFVKIAVGNPTAAQQHAALLRSHGADPRAVGTPGFARRSERDADRYARENSTMLSVPAAAYQRMGSWLSRRHRVNPRGLSTAVGTCVFLAETEKLNLYAAIKGLNAMEDA